MVPALTNALNSVSAQWGLRIPRRGEAFRQPGCGWRRDVNVWADEPGIVELPDWRRVRGTGARELRGHVPAPDLAVCLLGHGLEAIAPK